MEKKITGSDNLWESAGEMNHITDKLTRSKNYKTPEQLKKLAKLKLNQEKERIRQEILSTSPVTEMDTDVYSSFLATRSQKSKSDAEKREDEEKRK